MEAKLITTNDSSETTFPETFHTAGLFVQINDSPEYIVSTVHSPHGSVEAIPYKLEFKPVLIDKDSSEGFHHLKIVLPDGNTVTLTYKIIVE